MKKQGSVLLSVAAAVLTVTVVTGTYFAGNTQDVVAAEKTETAVETVEEVVEVEEVIEVEEELPVADKEAEVVETVVETVVEDSDEVGKTSSAYVETPSDKYLANTQNTETTEEETFEDEEGVTSSIVMLDAVSKNGKRLAMVEYGEESDIIDGVECTTSGAAIIELND